MNLQKWMVGATLSTLLIFGASALAADGSRAEDSCFSDLPSYAQMASELRASGAESLEAIHQQHTAGVCIDEEDGDCEARALEDRAAFEKKRAEGTLRFSDIDKYTAPNALALAAEMLFHDLKPTDKIFIERQQLLARNLWEIVILGSDFGLKPGQDAQVEVPFAILRYTDTQRNQDSVAPFVATALRLYRQALESKDASLMQAPYSLTHDPAEVEAWLRENQKDCSRFAKVATRLMTYASAIIRGSATLDEARARYREVLRHVTLPEVDEASNSSPR